jgi:Fe-S cluster assembly protein SufD
MPLTTPMRLEGAKSAHMNIQLARTPAESGFLTLFDEARDSLPGARSDWISGLRQDAIDAFRRAGIPHRRIEEWKYTDLRSALPQALPLALPVPAGGGVEPANYFAPIARHRLVFANGYLRPDLSTCSDLPDGVEVLGLAEAIAKAPSWVREHLDRIAPERRSGVFDLNTAFMAGGITIRVAAGVAVDRPIELAFVFTGDAPAVQAIRNLIMVEEGASATILETFRGAAGVDYLTNTATELVLGDGARVDHVKIQDESLAALHLASLSNRLGAAAVLKTFTASLGARVARNETNLLCAGRGGDAAISGAYMISGRQHCDSTMLVDHAVPECSSRELFKGVIDGSARGVFQGRIIVRPDAQKTDGRMMTKGLLLSPNAEFDAKPELEIFADDVQCAHGATSGELDDDLLFYLRSRGIPELQAKTMLIQAFVADAFEQVSSEEIRDVLNGLAGRWLEGSTKDVEHA